MKLATPESTWQCPKELTAPPTTRQEATLGMDLVFDQESEKGVVVGTAHGRLRLQELKESASVFWREVDAPVARVLWDLREATFELSSGDVEEFAHFGKRHSPFAGLKMAFLVSRDLEFGLIRMFEIFRATESAQTAVLRDKSQALQWLTGDSA